MEQVILAFEGEKNARHIRDIIESFGLAECLICHSAAEVKRLAGRQGIHAVICGYKLPDDTAQGLADDLPESCSILVLAVQSMLDLIGDDERVFKLSAPATRSDLLSMVDMILSKGCREELYTHAPRSQEEIHLIKKAKARLMEERKMNEEEAHRFLQKKSMDTGTKLPQTAQMVLDGAF